MPKQLAALLLTRRLPLKAEWSQRLRAGPVSSPLAMPEILIHRMDDTLHQLEGLLHRAPAARVPGRAPWPLARLHEMCRCGLSPLLDYFTTGAAALAVVLPDLAAADQTVLDHAWLRLARREVGSLCGVCRRAGVKPEEPLSIRSSNGDCPPAA